MIRVSEIGIALLWVTGLTMVYTKWGGFESPPWLFYLKLSAVVALTATLVLIHILARKAKAGDVAAAARIPVFGRAAFLTALLALILAVLAFA